MHKVFAALVALSICAPVAAGTCGPVKEYAQYKDKARTKAGRNDLASEYCLYARLMPLQQTTRDREECTAAKSKIIDALGEDKQAVSRAIGGCPEIFDKPAKK